MFRELAGLDAESPDFQRHRDKIVERCLPLADHIARRFEGRGEPRDDLVQVARVGLVNAVTHFSHDVVDYDRATEFEALGGKLIELSSREWQELAEAA